MPKRARADARAHPLGGPAAPSGPKGLARGADHGVGLSALRPRCTTGLIRRSGVRRGPARGRRGRAVRPAPPLTARTVALRRKFCEPDESLSIGASPLRAPCATAAVRTATRPAPQFTSALPRVLRRAPPRTRCAFAEAAGFARRSHDCRRRVRTRESHHGPRSGPDLPAEWPREESNLRARIRSPSLYPLSYGAVRSSVAASSERRWGPNECERPGYEALQREAARPPCRQPS